MSSSAATTRRRAVRTAVLASACAGALAGAPAAAQADVPAATTGGVSNLAPQSASLSGTVNPHGKTTAVFFQIGTTKAYGLNTAEAPAGAGTTARKLTTNLIDLRPATTYHYRIVARNADGTRVGGDKSFKTRNQPLGFTLAAAPNPVPYGKPVILQGVLSGTGNAGRQVALQQNLFPFTAGFQTVGNAQVTGATGAFMFPFPGALINGQYRVITAAGTKVVSAIVTLGVSVEVETRLSAHRVRRNGRIRFSGQITPAKPGALYAIQRQDSHGAWRVVAGGTSRTATASHSTFDRRATIRKSGVYRVFVGVTDGYHVSGVGHTKKISIRR